MQLTTEQRERFDRLAPCGAPDACWPWQGPRNSKGYGQFRLGTKRPHRAVTASRVAWSLSHGRDFPAGMLACHSCDNPPCVNPAHIWPGTHQQNVDDMYAKGRRPRAIVDRVCRAGHRVEGSNAQSHGRRTVCRTCRNARDRERSRTKTVVRLPRVAADTPYGHGKLCIRCGHHRTDDYSNGRSFACRPCNLAKARRRYRKEQAA